MTFDVDLTVRSEHYIPPDVLVEHIAVALKSLNFTGKIDITMNSATKPHPFDGPEVFDDSPQLEEYTGPKRDFATGGFLPFASLVDPFPLTTNAIDALRDALRDARKGTRKDTRDE